MEYKIGEVSKIVGVSTDLIRYYEEKGIITPKKNPNNGYRYYDAWDINFLIDCVWYKNYGFSIDEIVKIEWESTYDSLMDRFNAMENAMEAELHRKALLLERIKSQKASLKKVMKLFNKCEISKGPDMVYYLNRHNSDYEKDLRLEKVTKDWIKYMPLSKRYFEVAENPESSEDYSWGFSLEPKYVEEFKIKVKDPIKKRTGVRTIHSAFKSSGKNAFSPKHIDYMYKFAKQNNLKPCGRAYGTLICSVLDGGHLTGYFEVWLPIEE